MGNGESREAKRAARASNFSQAEYERQLGYAQGSRASAPAPGQASSPRSARSSATASAPSPASGGRKLTARPSFKGFSFQDSYSDLPSLQADLRRAGLESCNLLVAIDLTKSNEWSGRHSFGGKNLHSIDPSHIELNPYEASLQIIASTLSAFDEDGYIPLYGFGDSTTHDKAVMSFLPRDQPCHGLEQCLQAYRQVLPSLKLAGPTSFGPVIRKACSVVKNSGGNYHILLIVADGQVTRSSDLPPGELSPQERDTIEAVVEASYLPLSIIVVGVGDGEDGWKAMKELDDKLPSRNFDNLQFLSLSEALTKGHRAAPGGARATPQAIKQAMEATFALQALMEIPLQYKAINTLGLMDPRAVANVHIAPVATVDPPVIPLLGSPTSPGGAYGAVMGLGGMGGPRGSFHGGGGGMPSPAGGSFYQQQQSPQPQYGDASVSGGGGSTMFPQYLLGGGSASSAAASASSTASDGYPSKPQGQMQPRSSFTGAPGLVATPSGNGGPMASHQGDFGLSSLAMTTVARNTSSGSNASTSSASSTPAGSQYYSQGSNAGPMHSAASFSVPPSHGMTARSSFTNGGNNAAGGGWGAPGGAGGGDFVVPALSPGSVASLRSPGSPAPPPPLTSASSSAASPAYSPAAVLGANAQVSSRVGGTASPSAPAAGYGGRGSGVSNGSTVELDPTSPNPSGSGSSSQLSQAPGSASGTRSPLNSTGTSAASAAVVDDEAERLRRELDNIKQQQQCCICLEPIEDSGGARKRVAFQCGHATTCQQCSDRLENCPQCRVKIVARIKLHM